jgi:hypothetical protein
MADLEGGQMAIPIGETPSLKGKNAARFLSKVESDLRVPTKFVPTPRLAEVEKLIRKHVADKQKRVS